jgi:hypothetical protein
MVSYAVDAVEIRISCPAPSPGRGSPEQRTMSKRRLFEGMRANSTMRVERGEVECSLPGAAEFIHRRCIQKSRDCIETEESKGVGNEGLVDQGRAR